MRCPTIKWPKKLPHSNLMCPNHRYVLTLPKSISFRLQLTHCSFTQMLWIPKFHAMSLNVQSFCRLTVHTTATSCFLDVFASSWLSRFRNGYGKPGGPMLWPRLNKGLLFSQHLRKGGSGDFGHLGCGATFTHWFPLNGGKTLGKIDGLGMEGPLGNHTPKIVDIYWVHTLLTSFNHWFPLYWSRLFLGLIRGPWGG